MNGTVVRTLSGIGFVAVTLACLLLNQYLFAAYVIAIMIAMMAEFYRMPFGREKYRFIRALAILSGVVLFCLIFARPAFGMPARYTALAIIPALLVMVSSIFIRDKSEFDKLSIIYTGMFYIAVPLSLSNLLVFRSGSFSGLLILCFFLIIWASDVGAYIFGMAFGQRPGSKKLCPDISPKKSWIGFWGGMLFAVLAALILHWTGLLEAGILHCIVLAVLMDIAGVAGDLFESLWKRHYGVKDSGNIIPGHGGALDRFDSTLFAIPFGALYLALFNLI